MPVVVSAPGVYVDEVPSGARAITGAATSITAFIGPCLRGESALTSPPTRIGSWADFERVCGGLSNRSELSHAVRHFFLNGGSTALIVRVTAEDAGAARFELAAGPADALVLEARSPGEWGSALRVSIAIQDDEDALDYSGANGFHLTVTDTSTQATEQFRSLSLDPAAARFVTSVLGSQSRLVRVAVGSPLLRPDAGTDLAPSVLGTEGGAIVSDDVTAAAARLELADTVNLVHVSRFAADGTSVPTNVYEAVLGHCVDLRAMLLVDPPDSWVDFQAAADMTDVTSLQSPNALMIHPRVEAVDPLRDNLVREFAPSGFVAGVIARTDATRGVWKAPAGVEATMRGVSRAREPLTQDRMGVLNQRGVNALTTRPAAGVVVWGSRTAVGADTRASEWKYVPVRRTALFIEESLRRGLQWVVFEPNDEPLWSQIRVAVGTFMQRLFIAGAFQGQTPREAYLVKCDAETTTAADVDLGIVNIIVGFAPLKPAEFVILKFQQIAGQSGT